MTPIFRYTSYYLSHGWGWNEMDSYISQPEIELVYLSSHSEQLSIALSAHPQKSKDKENSNNFKSKQTENKKEEQEE